MKRKRRPAKLNLIKPGDLDLKVWQMLTAARAGQRGKVTRLLAEDPSLLAREFWYTKPLHFAVREGHLELVRLLLSKGDDSTWIRYGHEDLVTVARDRNHDGVAKLLVADRLEHNVDRTRPIHLAAAGRDLATIE